MEFKSYNPSDENIRETLEKDVLGRNKDIVYFISLLNSIDNSCAIALNGEWGSGKTFFVKQVKLLLDKMNPHIINHCDDPNLSETSIDNLANAVKSRCNNIPNVSVYYDCWENDNDDDPILSLVHAIMQSTVANYSTEDFKNRSGFINAGAALLDSFAKTGIRNFVDAIKSEDALESLKKAKSLEIRVKEFLESLLPECGDRLILFIDELDRCKPSYAVKMLERIKHYLTSERITVVFSVNINELQHTIGQFYGSTFDSCRYLDRFFDLRVSLPPVDLEKYFGHIGFEARDTMYSIVCRTVIDYFHFELREIERFVHLTKIAFSESMRSTITYENAFDEGKGRSLYITCYVPVLIALSIINQNMYYVFIHGNDESSIKLFTDIMCKNDDIISYILHLLVGDHEQLSSNEDERKKLCKNKLMETYDAIFNRSNTSYGYISINRCSFGTNAREEILRIVSLLSRYADYSE